MNKTIVAIIIVLVVAAGGAYVATRNQGGGTTMRSGTSTASSCTAPSGNTILFCDGKFVNTLTVPAGTAVTFKNGSNDTIQVDSNPHPIHTDEPELNVGTLQAGQSQTVTLTKVGTWGFHDHLQPSITGHLTVTAASGSTAPSSSGSQSAPASQQPSSSSPY
jgi:plastocyanin